MILFHLQRLGAERHIPSFLTVGEDPFQAAKSLIFQEKGKTYQNIRILTMCKIYNVNNNKTADIRFYYYTDEVI